MGFLADGKKIEQQFASLIGANEFSTKQQDINEHWDVKYSVKIDVKGLKRINRNDAKFNEAWHWIELKNVRGNMGWLYGEADYFAFELINYWVLVDKLKLQNFISNRVENKIFTKKMPYKLYRRANRKDLITIINSFDLTFLAEKIIAKTEFNSFENLKF